MEELRSRQEAERKNQEANHSQKMDSLKLQYETSIEGQLIFSRISVVRMRCFPRSADADECLCVSELKRIQQTDVENLEKTLRETETSLSVRRLLNSLIDHTHREFM